LSSSQLNVGTDSGNAIAQRSSSRQSRDRFLEESKKFKNEKGEIVDRQGYREAYNRYAEGESLRGYEQSGISKPVVRGQNESVGGAVERSAVETAQMVSAVNPGKDVSVRVALQREAVVSREQRDAQRRQAEQQYSELGRQGYVGRDFVVSGRVIPGVGRQTIAEAQKRGAVLSSGRKSGLGYFSLKFSNFRSETLGVVGVPNGVCFS